MGVWRFEKIFIYMRNTSIAINTDYMIVIHNPVIDTYEHHMYHILDISDMDGKKLVNIQYTDINGALVRVAMPHDKFLKLIVLKVLTPIQ